MAQTAAEKYLAQFKADALKAGKTEAEADALVAVEKERVDALLAHPLHKGLADELKGVIGDRDTFKRQVGELTPQAEEARRLREQGMSEVEKLKSRLAELEPKAGRVDALESAIKATLESRLATVPEHMRALMPEGTPEQQLAWIERGHAAKAFGERQPVGDGDGTPGGGAGGGRTIKESAFVAANETQRKGYREQVAKGELTVVPG